MKWLPTVLLFLLLLATFCISSPAQLFSQDTKNSETEEINNTTKTVQSCGSCHVMGPFVNDLYDPESSTYGAHGTLRENVMVSGIGCFL
ncbi:hypothetical protein BH23BAC3_BH23BAC3_31050 [soil metagenome]